MNLSPKAIRFIIDALDYKINAYQERLKLEDLDEDEASDITNDSGFLKALRRELAKTLNKSESLNVLGYSDSPSSGDKFSIMNPQEENKK